MEILSIQSIFKPRNLIVAGIVLVAALLAGGYYAYDSMYKNQDRPTTTLFSGKRFSSEELIRAEIAFADAKLNQYTLKDGTILVPTTDRDRYILALKNSDVLVTPEKSKTSNCSTSFWESEKQREEKNLREKQEKLAATIRTFHGIETADVLLDTMELKTGFQRERVTSASITVRSVPEYTLSESDLQAIINLVQGAVCGLKAEKLTIVDTRTNQSWRHTSTTSATSATSETSTETVTTSQKVTFAVQDTPDSQPYQESRGTALEMLQPRRQPILVQNETPLESPHLEAPTLPSHKLAQSDVTPVPATTSSAVSKSWIYAGVGGSLAVLFVGLLVLGRKRSKTSVVPSTPNVISESKRMEEPEVTKKLQEEKPLSPPPEPAVIPVVETPPEPVAAILPEIPPVAAKLPEVQNTPKKQTLPEISALEKIENEKLARVLAEERPQTIALVLAQFQAEKRDALQGLLPEKLATQVFERISRCESPDPEILRDVANSILENVSELKENSEVKANSPEPEKPMENAVDAVFSQMRSVRFDDLQFMTAPELRAILEVSPPPVAVMAMIGAPPELVDKMLGILSRSEAEKVRKVLENPGKVRLSDVEKARRKLAEIASSI